MIESYHASTPDNDNVLPLTVEQSGTYTLEEYRLKSEAAQAALEAREAELAIDRTKIKYVSKDDYEGLKQLGLAAHIAEQELKLAELKAQAANQNTHSLTA